MVTRGKLVLGGLCSLLSLVAIVLAYLQWGFLESGILGQIQHVRRLHIEGPRFQAKRAWGVFPRAQGLLEEPFVTNAWSVSSREGLPIYQSEPTWWAVPLADIPPEVRAVFLFAEDRRFAQHPGVDAGAVLRALGTTLLSVGTRRQGGSTIAMQVAKHALLELEETPVRTGLKGVWHKLREVLLALRLVQRAGRDPILAYYLNHAYFGSGNYGIGPAAFDYFRKLPQQLSLGEAAWLAAMLPAPTRDARKPGALTRHETRRQLLLQAMRRAGTLDDQHYQQACSPPRLHEALVRTRRQGHTLAPQSAAAAWPAIHAILARFALPRPPSAVRQMAPFPPFPLRVTVSLHEGLSRHLAQAAAPVGAGEGPSYAGLLLVDGRPVSFLGGAPGAFNYVWQARRQLGSAAKLFFFDIVWRQGYLAPDDRVWDDDLPESVRQRFGRPPYHPKNNDDRSHGEQPHHRCLSLSLNKCSYRSLWGERTERQRSTIAQELVQRFRFPWSSYGEEQSATTPRRFIQRFVTDETVVLGTWRATPWEVATMLEQGFRGSTLSPEHLLLSWNDRLVSGAPSPQATTGGLSRALGEALQAAVKETAPAAVVRHADWVLAAKTGTTDGGRDAWFIGFLLTPQEAGQPLIRPRVTLVGWAGYADNRKTDLYGGSVHGPVWGRFLQNRAATALLRAVLRR